MDKKQVKSIADVEAKKVVAGHEKRMHKGVTKMKAGGKTDADMLKMGRGLAKVANQSSAGKKG